MCGCGTGSSESRQTLWEPCELFTYEAIGSDQDVYWVNETFDAIYYEALETMDNACEARLVGPAPGHGIRDARMPVHRLQGRAVRREHGVLGVREPGRLEQPSTSCCPMSGTGGCRCTCTRTRTTHPTCGLLRPDRDIEAEVGVPELVNAYANDDDPTTSLEYKWFWGDGTKSGWTTSTMPPHIRQGRILHRGCGREGGEHLDGVRRLLHGLEAGEVHRP